MSSSEREYSLDIERQHAASLLDLSLGTRHPSFDTIETATGPLLIRREVSLDARNDETRVDGYFEPPLPDGTIFPQASVRGDLAESGSVGWEVERVVDEWMAQHQEAVAARVAEMGGLAVPQVAEAV